MHNFLKKDRKIHTFGRLKYLFIVGLTSTLGAYGAINYSEYFPNSSTVLQSQSNGWTTPINSASKEIMTPEGCQDITSTQGIRMFIPTKTLAEWNSFKNKLPTGVTISPCYTYIWIAGGWGSCIGSCGGIGTQTRTVNCKRNDGVTVADSYCTGGKPATSQSCSTDPCYVPCTSYTDSVACVNAGCTYGPFCAPYTQCFTNTNVTVYLTAGPVYENGGMRCKYFGSSYGGSISCNEDQYATYGCR